MFQRDKNSGESYATPPNGKCLIITADLHLSWQYVAIELSMGGSTQHIGNSVDTRM